MLVNAWLYTSTRAYPCKVEVQACTCRRVQRETIGPDLGKYGIFNWSNSTLFSHEVLNRYTSGLTNSPTPLPSYHSTTQRQYQACRSPQLFVKRGMFSNAWFALVALQEITTAMECRQCGPHPQIVVADGVSISFGQNKLTGTLIPPTKHQDDSRTRNNIVPLPNKVQMFGPRKLRESLRKAIKGLEAAAIIQREEASIATLLNVLATLGEQDNMQGSALRLSALLKADLTTNDVDATSRPWTCDRLYIELLLDLAIQAVAHDSLA